MNFEVIIRTLVESQTYRKYVDFRIHGYFNKCPYVNYSKKAELRETKEYK